jgi:hypothetical protein
MAGRGHDGRALHHGRRGRGGWSVTDHVGDGGASRVGLVRDVVLRVRLGLLVQRVRPVVGRGARLAADRLAEVADTGAQRSTDLRKALGAKDQQRDDEDEQEMSGLEDVADH